MMTLRPYQLDAIAAVRRDWSDGFNAVLGTAATGAGKTQIFLGVLTDVLTPADRALIIAHRQELIEQPIDRLAQFWPAWGPRSGVVMADRDDYDRQIVVATVQTLASERRLARLLSAGPISHLVTDEAHHATCPTYRNIYDALREVNPGLLHLGVTATPIRADGEALRQVFQKESFHYGIKEMVTQRWLVPPRWLAIQTGISLAGVAQHDGDYSVKSLANVYETQNCFDLVVETHKKYAADRQCIAFVETVDGAYRLAETFNKAGITAQAADGTTGKQIRGEILTRFRRRETQVLCNVALYTEGLDVPEVSCIHQVRPTKSDGLYIQCIGRALRPVPGKEDALILDYAPLEARNIVMLGDVLGVTVRKDVYVKEMSEPGEILGGFTFDGKIKWLTGDPMEIISRQLDYLDLSPWSWSRGDQDGWLTLGLGKGPDDVERILVISRPNEIGECVLWQVSKGARDRWYNGERIAQADFATLSDRADELISKYGNAVLAQKAKRWRKEPASEAQASCLKRMGYWRDGISKGEATEAITRNIALRAVRYMA